MARMYINILSKINFAGSGQDMMGRWGKESCKAWDNMGHRTDNMGQNLRLLHCPVDISRHHTSSCQDIPHHSPQVTPHPEDTPPPPHHPQHTAHHQTPDGLPLPWEDLTLLR